VVDDVFIVDHFSLPTWLVKQTTLLTWSKLKKHFLSGYFFLHYSSSFFLRPKYNANHSVPPAAAPTTSINFPPLSPVQVSGCIGAGTSVEVEVQKSPLPFVMPR
jgi:hypothetical protein